MKQTNVNIPLRYIYLEGIWHVRQPLYLIDKTLQRFNTDTYHIQVRGERRMLTQDPQIINHILQKNHKNYEKSKLATEVLSKYAGQGILVTNGQTWLKQRRLLQPGFRKKKINELIAEMNDQILIDLNKLKSVIASGKNQVDLLQEMSKITLKVVSRALFSFNISEAEMEILHDGFQAMQSSALTEAQLPLLQKWKDISGQQKILNRKIKRFIEFIQPIIEKRKTDEDPPEDLLTMLLLSRYEDSKMGMSDQQILDELVIFFIAGFETSTNALSFALFLLAKNQKQMSIIRKEIEEHEISDRPEVKDVMSLRYTQQVIYEAMRLYPPAWFLDRVALNDDVVEGEQIRKGDIVALYTFGMHRSKKYWDNPLSFDPSRFSDAQKDKLPPHAYIPFGGGPRLCIGSHFAMMEMSLILYHFIKLFRFQIPTNFELKLDAKLTLRPKQGMPMKLILHS